MSDQEPSAAPEASDGIGCRSLLTAVGVLLSFAVAAVAIGLWMIGFENPTPTQELIGLTAYAAGAPVSGLFAALAGDLPLAIYLDVLVWVLAAAGIARLADRGRSIVRLAAMVAGIALVYGIVIASTVELV